MQYFIDTNVFLRVLIRENELSFRESRAVLELIKNKRIAAFTSNMVLAEVAWTLLSFYKFPKRQVVKALQGIIYLKGLKFKDAFDNKLAVEIYQKHNIKFIDAVIASHPMIFKKGAAIISYDKDFDKIGTNRLEPGSVIKN